MGKSDRFGLFKSFILREIGEMGYFWAYNKILKLFIKSLCQFFLKLHPMAGINEWVKVTVLDF